MPAMTFANLGNFKLQKWGFLLCNSVHFYFTTNIVDEEHGIFIKFYVTINKITENKITEVIDFVMSLENNRHDQEFKQLMYASKSSMDSWNNDVDDEIWNDL
mgnify:CR=1 FL=1